MRSACGRRTPRCPASLDAPAGGRPSRAPRPHPFAADPGVLGDALGLLGEGPRDLAGKAAADELTLWLPSAGPGPGCAPELIRPADPDEDERGDKRGPGRGRRAALGCWRVPALAFGPAAALTLLAALDPVDSPSAAAAHPDLIAGGSAVYWAAVARFAADLCARGRILPVLDRAGGGAAGLGSAGGDLLPGSAGGSLLARGLLGQGWAAAWRPVLTGPDAPRAAELAGAMPPVCRAGEPGGQPPGPLLAAALDALADAAARARLDASAAGPGLGAASPGLRGSTPAVPARRPRAALGPAPAAPRAPPARVPVAERWAAALTGPDAGGRGGHRGGRGGGGRAGRRPGRLARRRPGPGRPGAHLLPAGGARRSPTTRCRKTRAQARRKTPGRRTLGHPKAASPPNLPATPGTSSSPSSRPRIPA